MFVWYKLSTNATLCLLTRSLYTFSTILLLFSATRLSPAVVTDIFFFSALVVHMVKFNEINTAAISIGFIHDGLFNQMGLFRRRVIKVRHIKFLPVTEKFFPKFPDHCFMNKNRLEAFSDGVLAIIITIMVLELKTPH